MWLMTRACVNEVMFCFFFFSSRRRHTRYWRDWSSDVCSSDLSGPRAAPAGAWNAAAGAERTAAYPSPGRPGEGRGGEIGRGAGRGRGEISGGAGTLKKKKLKTTKNTSRTISQLDRVSDMKRDQ